MFRSALATMAMTRAGLKVREELHRRLRVAMVVAIAAAMILLAAIFALVAGYNWLVATGFTPTEAALVVAAAFFLLGMIALATLPLVGRPRRSELERALDRAGPAGAIGVVDKQLGQVVQRVGPLGILATAFAIGMAAGRR